MLFFANIDKQDIIVSFWEDELELQETIRVATMCFAYQSGAVLQVGPRQTLNRPRRERQLDSDFVILRIFFLGDRFKKIHPCAHVRSSI